MRVVTWIRRPFRYALRTRFRATVGAVLMVAVGVGGRHGVRVARGHTATSRGEEALARYDFSAARRHFVSAADLRPRHPRVWLLAAQAARRDGDLLEAKNHLGRFRGLAGPTPDGRLEEALQHAQGGDIERDVHDLMAKADSGHPATEQILEALAVGSVHVYHFHRAEFWVHHLLTRYPRNPVGLLIRAHMDDVLGKRDRAAARCREILADFPDHERAKSLLAGLHFRAQQYAEAAILYEELRRQRTDDLRPLLGLARSLDRLGRSDEARQRLRELEEEFAGNSEALLECGRAALADGRVGDAERLLRRSVELAPSNHEAHYQLAMTLERVGKADEARQHFERFKQVEADVTRLDNLLKAVINNPRDPAPRREAGLICLRNGQPVEGLRWLLGAVEIAPNDKETHAALADYYHSHGNGNLSWHHRQRAR